MPPSSKLISAQQLLSQSSSCTGVSFQSPKYNLNLKHHCSKACMRPYSTLTKVPPKSLSACHTRQALATVFSSIYLESIFSRAREIGLTELTLRSFITTGSPEHILGQP